MGRGAVAFRRPLLAAIVTAVLTLGVDQATKAAVRAYTRIGESFDILPPVLHLTHVANEGAAFGVMQGRQPLFVLTSALVLTAIVVYLVRFAPASRMAVVALGLIAGGAMGNLIDRISLGRVTDFIDFQVGAFQWPVFNAADSAIVVGVTVLMYRLLFAPAPSDRECEVAEG